MKVNYYLSPYPNEDGSRLIRMYISDKGDRFYFKTPIKLGKKDCPKPEKGKISKRSEKEVIPLKLTLPLRGSQELKDYSFLLEKWEDEARQHWRTALKTDLKPNKEYFERKLSISEKSKDDFFEIWDKFIEEQGKHNEWSEGYKKQMSAMKKTLEEMDKKKGVTFKAMDNKFLTRFLDHHKGIYNATIINKYTLLKSFLTWATKENYNQSVAFRNWKFKLKNPPKEIYALDRGELVKIIRCDFDDQEIKDCFLFQCFSSLRYGDLKNLKHDDFTDTHITYVPEKDTEKTITVKLSDPLIEIRNKYKDRDPVYALPVTYPNKYNMGIRRLGKEADLDRLVIEKKHKYGEKPENEKVKLYTVLSSHSGRKTYVTTCKNSFNLQSSMVAKSAGHTEKISDKLYTGITADFEDKVANGFSGIYQEAKLIVVKR